MGLCEAVHLGQSCYNKDNNRLASALVTGKRSKAERDGDDIVEQEVGLFHQLPSELTDSLIVSAKRQADKSRRTFNEALRVQAAAREEKQKALRDNKIKAAEEILIAASYLHQQYHSPRCWRSKKQSFEIIEQLKFKKDRLSSVKEQILIRYLGLGWVEAHHPWSKKGHGTYSAAELLEHFVKVVLPLEKTHTVPDEPPLTLPGLPKSLCRLGTRAQDCIDLETSLGSEEMGFRPKALRKRDSFGGEWIWGRVGRDATNCMAGEIASGQGVQNQHAV